MMITGDNERTARAIARSLEIDDVMAEVLPEGKADAVIAEQLRMGVATLERLRRRFVEEGLEASLRERPRPGARPKLGPKEQAFVVALACTKPPEGRERWTMQLLADRVVELQIVPDITDEAIRRLLKKTRSSPGSRRSG